MTEQSKTSGSVFLQTLRQMLPSILTVLALTAVMLGVYALLGYFGKKVLLGALLGCGVSLLNFVAMIYSLLRAEKKENPLAGQVAVRGAFLLRMAVLLVVLIFALRSKLFDPIATLLPLCFLRLSLFVPQLKQKHNEKEVMP